MREWLSKMLAPRSTDEVVARKEHILNIVVFTMGALSLFSMLASTLAVMLGATAPLF